MSRSVLTACRVIRALSPVPATAEELAHAADRDVQVVRLTLSTLVQEGFAKEAGKRAKVGGGAKPMQYVRAQ